MILWGMANRSQDWLNQAENDLRWGRDSLSAGHFAPACFVAQQVAEKALKSIGYARGADLVKGHSVLVLVEDLGINGPIREAAQRLDQYYISTRYPDSVPSGAPFQFFTEKQAIDAIAMAETFVARARQELGRK